MTYEFHTTPFEHQRTTFEYSKDLPAYGILWEQGCGKSKIAIDTACHLYEKGEIDAVFIVAPNGVHRNWLTDEMPTHIPTRLRSKIKAEYWDTGKSAAQHHKFRMEQLLKHKGFPWFMVSYDGIMTDRGRLYCARFLRLRRCLYILDEAHNIKSPNTQRTKRIVASGKYAPYRRLLTGTPVAQGPFDVYSQVKFIDENFWKRHGLDNFALFKFHFGEWWTKEQAKKKSGYDPGYDKLLGYKNLDQLSEFLKSISNRVTKESAGLNLPPKLYSKRYYEMLPAQRDLYEKIRDEYIAELEDGAIVDGALAIVRLLRLQQIICGYVQTDDAEEPVRLISEKNPRLALLGEITESLYHPAIIWARFTKDVDQIMELLGDKAVRYDGRVSDDEAAEAKRKFQSGEAQFFVGNPAKGKEGLTLVQARTVIYYSNSFKLIDRLQSEDRAHRIGQHHPVDYIDLVAPGTVDERIVSSLRDKFDIATKITGDDLKEWL
jgi:SNF2 family DNA or RNA helicase